MKVIKWGTAKDRKVKRVMQIKCLYCHTLAEYEPEEINTERDEHGEKDDFVYCPLCNLKLWKHGLLSTWTTMIKPV